MKIQEINTQKIRSIKLPSSLRNGRVLVIQNKDTLTIKKVGKTIRTREKPSPSKVHQKLKSAKGLITEEEINQEVQNYRQGK